MEQWNNIICGTVTGTGALMVNKDGTVRGGPSLSCLPYGFSPQAPNNEMHNCSFYIADILLACDRVNVETNLACRIGTSRK